MQSSEPVGQGHPKVGASFSAPRCDGGVGARVRVSGGFLGAGARGFGAFLRGLAHPGGPRAREGAGGGASAPGRGSDHLAQGLALPGGVVAVGLGQVAEAPVEPDDGDGGVGQAGQVAGQAPALGAASVFVVGEVADVVEAVLDLPVAAVEGEELRRAGPLRPQGRDAEDGVRRGPPGADDVAARGRCGRLGAGSLSEIPCLARAVR